MVKKFIATKVFSNDCVICEHMSRYDRSVFEGFPSVAYQEVDLDAIVDNGGDPTKLRLYQIIERNALNNDYTVDVPLYIVMDKQGKYMGHHSGEASIVELRNEIRNMIGEGP